MAVDQIAVNLRRVEEQIARAAEACGRTADEIRLVAVSKTFPAEAVRTAIDAGHLLFGENRVQEAEPKIQALRGTAGIEWHLVGHLQSNKAKRAAALFDAVHSLDSVKLAVLLSEACLAARKTMPVLLQVDFGYEDTKFGAEPAEVRQIISVVSGLRGIKLDGLMTLPPFYEDPELARPYFSALRNLRDALQTEEPGCLGSGHLSMGMSHDFEVAIQEGATIIRVGTAIFGARWHG